MTIPSLTPACAADRIVREFMMVHGDGLEGLLRQASGIRFLKGHRLIREYARFLALCFASARKEDPVVSPHILAIALQVHRSDEKSFKELCRIFGSSNLLFDEVGRWHKVALELAYLRQMDTYEQSFGCQPDVRVWPNGYEGIHGGTRCICTGYRLIDEG